MDIDNHRDLDLFHVLLRISRSCLATCGLFRRASKMRLDLSSFIDIQMAGNAGLPGLCSLFEAQVREQDLQTTESQRSPFFSSKMSF